MSETRLLRSISIDYIKKMLLINYVAFGKTLVGWINDQDDLE